MAFRKLPPIEYLRQLIDYDMITGEFTHKARTPEMFKKSTMLSQEVRCASWNRRFVGKPAGVARQDGYILITIKNIKYRASRVAWFMVTGDDDINMDIDHINTNTSDNRFCNLRKASRAQNLRNRRVRRDNKLGVKGVFRRKDTGAYVMQISFGGNLIRKEFKTVDEARSSYEFLSKTHFGEFARTE